MVNTVQVCLLLYMIIGGKHSNTLIHLKKKDAVLYELRKKGGQLYADIEQKTALDLWN